MPELPEAETIVRGLRRAVVGERIRRVEIRHEDILREPRRSFADKVRGRRIGAVARRGKNVLLELDGDRIMAINLGMTGGLLPFKEPPSRDRRATHPTVILRFESGGLLVFDDQRRFGRMECLPRSVWAERSRRMGPEPLDRTFTSRDLRQALSGSRSPVRSWLLDQRRIAGVGNIYANEALHRARVHPRTPARGVDADAVGRLHRSLRQVLRAAIRAGGTTVRNYRDAEGRAGRYARRLDVYGREGEPCRRCGAEIRRVVFGNRSAFFCPACQPAPIERVAR